MALVTSTLWAPAPALAGRYPLGEAEDALSSPVSVDYGELITLDIDDDGLVDAATIDDDVLTLWRGTETGWGSAYEVSLPSSMQGGDDCIGCNPMQPRAAVGDFTSDALDDALVAIGNTLVLVRGDAGGQPEAPQEGDTITVAPPAGSLTDDRSALDAADVDSDGDLDAVVGFTSIPYGVVATLANSGDGTLADTLAHLAVERPSDLALVALGGDNDPDLVVAERPLYPPPGPGGPPTPSKLTRFVGTTGAGFSPGEPVEAGPGPLVDIEVGDFDDDGVSDLLLARQRGSEALVDVLTVLEGNDSGPGFAAPRILASAGLRPPISVADFDRNGAQDLYTSSTDIIGYRQGRRFLRGNGDLTFMPPGGPPFYDLYTAHGSTRIADIDGDGALDTLELVGQQLSPYTRQVEVHFGLWPLVRPDMPPTDIDLGTVTVGDTGPSITLPFVNDGPDAAEDLIVLADGDIEQFSVGAETCSGSTLAVGDTCTFEARFTPRAPGEFAVSLAVIGASSDELAWTPWLFGVGKAPATSSPSSPPASSPTPPAAAPKPSVSVARTGKPRLIVRKKRARLKTGLQVICPPGPARCTAALTLSRRVDKRGKARLIARAKVTVEPATRRELGLVLPRRMVANLRRRGRLPVTLDITATRTGATPVMKSARFTLRYPRR